MSCYRSLKGPAGSKSSQIFPGAPTPPQQATTCVGINAHSPFLPAPLRPPPGCQGFLGSTQLPARWIGALHTYLEGSCLVGKVPSPVETPVGSTCVARSAQRLECSYRPESLDAGCKGGVGVQQVLEHGCHGRPDMIPRYSPLSDGLAEAAQSPEIFVTASRGIYLRC